MAGAAVISHTVRRTAQAIVASLGVLACLAGLTALCYVYNVRADLSPGGRFTLSDHALGVLHDLDQPIRISAFIRTEDPRNPVLKDLLWQAAHESHYIDYSMVDINRNPALATRYGVDAYGATVVENRTRQAHFSLPVEAQLISAILQVVQPPKNLCVLTGHGECSIHNVDRRSGCTIMRDALSAESYQLRELNLLAGGEVAGQCSVVMIPGPRSDLLAGELSSLQAYVESGGRLLVLVDPFRAPRLAAFLHRYGVELGNDVLLDPENRLAGGEAFSMVVTGLNRQHLITARLDAPPLLSAARTVDARTDESVGREARWLLRSGKRSWASHDRKVLQGARPAFVAGRDVNGPLPLGVEVALPATGSAAKPGRKSGIIVYGDSDFVTNRFLDYLGNRDLLVNSVNWLAREERLISSRPKARKPGTEVFFVSQAQMTLIFWLAAVVEPALFILIGLSLFVWRRLRP